MYVCIYLTIQSWLGFLRWTEPLYNYQPNHNQLMVVEKQDPGVIYMGTHLNQINEEA